MRKSERSLLIVEWAAGVVLSLLAVILHLRWSTHAGALWRDEAATVQFATMPNVSEIWANLAYDNFPPLLLVPLRAWIALFGRSDQALRCFGFALGLTSLAAFWASAHLFRTRAPLVLLAIVGLSPLAAYTIDSIRPYGLGISLMCFMVGIFWHAATSQRVGVIGFAAIVAVLGVQSLYQNVPFLLAAVCASVIVAARRRDYRAMCMILLAAAAAVLSLLIHLPHLIAGRQWGLVSEIQVPFAYVLGEASAALTQSGWAAWIGVAVAIAVLPTWTVLISVRKEAVPNALLFAAVSSLVGCVAFMLLITQAKLRAEAWYYVIAIVFAALCVDAASSYSNLARWLRVTFAVIAAVAAFPFVWTHTVARQTNIDRIAKHVVTEGNARDLVIVYPWYGGVTWNYYFHGAAQWTTIPPLNDVRIHRYDLLKEQMARQDQQQVIAPVIEQIRSSLKAGGGIWLVGALPSPPSDGPPLLLPAPLPGTGWSSDIYETGWAMRVGEFLQKHVLLSTNVSTGMNQPVNPFENFSLTVLTGWRESE